MAVISDNFRISVLTWDWTPAKRRAALDVADDAISDVEISTKAGITDRQLRTWKKHPAFAAYVDRLRERVSADNEDLWSVSKRARLIVLQDALERMLGVVGDRAGEYLTLAVDDDVAAVGLRSLRNFFGQKIVPAGGTTGMVVRQVKQIGDQVVEEFAFDAALVKEVRATLEQIAKEAGQWETKVGVSHSGTIKHDHRVRNFSAFDDHELDALEALAAKAAGIDLSVDGV